MAHPGHAADDHHAYAADDARDAECAECAERVEHPGAHHAGREHGRTVRGGYAGGPGRYGCTRRDSAGCRGHPSDQRHGCERADAGDGRPHERADNRAAGHGRPGPHRRRKTSPQEVAIWPLA